MRDLEFRAWDKERNIMIKAALLYLPFWVKGYIPDGKDYEFYEEDTGYYFLGADKAAIMQFTGLLDKNGKKIFEGDILRPIRHNAINRFEVKYYGCAFMVFNLIRPSPPSFLDDCKNLIVCGNIYQNQELLEKKDV